MTDTAERTRLFEDLTELNDHGDQRQQSNERAMRLLQNHPTVFDPWTFKMDWFDFIDLSNRAVPQRYRDDLPDLTRALQPNLEPAATFQCIYRQQLGSYGTGFTPAGVHPLNFLLDDKIIGPTDKRVRMQRMKRAFRRAPAGTTKILAQRCLKTAANVPYWREVDAYLKRNRNNGEFERTYESKPDSKVVHFQPLFYTWNSVDEHDHAFPAADKTDVQAMNTCFNWVRHLRDNRRAFDRLNRNQKISNCLEVTHAYKLPSEIQSLQDTEQKERNAIDLMQANVVMALLTDYPGLVEQAPNEQTRNAKKRTHEQI